MRTRAPRRESFEFEDTLDVEQPVVGRLEVGGQKFAPGEQDRDALAAAVAFQLG